MTAYRESELPMDATIATVLGQEHQSAGGQVCHHVHMLGRQKTDRNQTLLQSQRLQHHDDLWL